MARQCLTYGCLYPAVAGRSRCSRCGPSNPARQGPNPYDYQWQKLREHAECTLPKVCGLCGRPILEGQIAHLDHIRPLSLGGTALTLGEVQWTHQGCNIRKGGRNRLR
jgi:5-methylcytosine-specific restriction endonuclease McrA